MFPNSFFPVNFFPGNWWEHPSAVPPVKGHGKTYGGKHLISALIAEEWSRSLQNEFNGDKARDINSLNRLSLLAQISKLDREERYGMEIEDAISRIEQEANRIEEGNRAIEAAKIERGRELGNVILLAEI